MAIFGRLSFIAKAARLNALEIVLFIIDFSPAVIWYVTCSTFAEGRTSSAHFIFGIESPDLACKYAMSKSTAIHCAD